MIIRNYDVLIENYFNNKLKNFSESLLKELIGKFDKIKKAEDYIPNFDSKQPYSSYKDEPELLEVKADLADMLEDLKKNLLEISKVRRVSFEISPYYGLSNYLTVYLDKPSDPKFLITDNIRTKYKMKFKLSDHFNSGEEEFNYDLIGKTFSNIAINIENDVRQRINELNQKEKNWNNKHKNKKTK